jgi:uncharacterized protein YbbC (DUF1343 family)
MILLLLLLKHVQYPFCQQLQTGKNILNENNSMSKPAIRTGADRTEMYVPQLKDKRIGLVVNQSSVIGEYGKEVHLADSLHKLGIKIDKIFVPEHGFRGTADAGEKIDNTLDPKTKIPIISLYGNKKKPAPEDLNNIDIMLFDIQDVGARFYTYISTLHYVMESCAENNIPLVILDRPNPNGFYIDGPVLKPEYKSFVGMHPVPIVHGMTIGEYARMINGERWLEAGKQCRLTVIPCQYYHHNETYQLRIKPSPNLPNMTAVYLYPSLCLFEGTIVSVGRGTDKPFQIIGYPEYPVKEFEFTPKSVEGAKNPPYLNVTCYGIDLKNFGKEYFLQRRSLDLSWLIALYKKYPHKEKFFTPFFDKLAGTDELRKQIENGKSEEEIRQSWHQDIVRFLEIRKKYLLYPDFY